MPDDTSRNDPKATPSPAPHVPAPTPPGDDAPSGEHGDTGGRPTPAGATDSPPDHGAPDTRHLPAGSDTADDANDATPKTGGAPGDGAVSGRAGTAEEADEVGTGEAAPGVTDAGAGGASSGQAGAVDDTDAAGAGGAASEREPGGAGGMPSGSAPHETSRLEDVDGITAAGGHDDGPITAHTDATTGKGAVPRVPDHVRELEGEQDLTPDPLVDLEQRKREAGADKLAPFGRPGQPLGKAHPFVFGFVAALGVITAWMLVQAILDARNVIVLIVVSMFLAIGLNPAVERLQRARLPRSGAVAVVFLGLVLGFVGVGFAVIPPLTEQVTRFIDHLPAYIEQLGENERIQELDREYQLLRKAQDAVTDPNFGQTAIGGVVGFGRAVAGGLFNTLTVLILTLYFLSSLPTIKTFFYRLVPRSRRARVALLGDEILLRIGGYVAGSATVALIAATAAYVFLSIMEVPFALPLALFVGLTALIPLVGATIGAVLACTVAFFDGLWTGIICVIFFVVYQQIENYLIHPRVMKRAVDVQPAVTIIAALIGGALLGIVGALLAIPTAAALALIVREVVIPRQNTL
ncbi:AI-2E family transporter [Thermomonospora cellulosilytica]|uniref:Putative PurR-regulated permease PerM n=1 Tax=Thermomonospora cellulosilytica TaxID=1411118 RepID=A0A7W3RCU5_9ACTN|nr:AI-2E family transporter [Thermomonospora cellulosilytica]MBA9007680.1 putative PurR-regulated permease PerM [Thermomonospora cellulosilytica]